MTGRKHGRDAREWKERTGERYRPQRADSTLAT